MKPDFLTYKRATNVSLLGLGLQFVLGAALMVISRITHDMAGFSGSILLLCGCVVWVTLAVVFDQHRRERMEALESETLSAAEARQRTVFEESADDLRVAAKRLAWMHRVLVPAASLLTAALFIGMGLWLLKGSWELVAPEKFTTPREPNLGIGVGLTLAVVGFVFARFVSGMGQQPAWSALKAGAAQSVACALVGLAMAVGRFVDIAGPDAVLRYLQPAIPMAMLVLGGEFILNFLLNIYRPRKPGQYPRPAFDSWILGFVAAPDRIAESIGDAINYQFGFSVTGSWFYRLLSRSLVVLAVIGAVVVWAMTTVGVVGPDERGLLLRNGSLVREVGPGAYFKWPWPFESIDRYRTTTLRKLNLASPPPTSDKAILWTNQHGDEGFYIVRGTTADEDGGRSGSDAAESLVVAEVTVFYTIENFERYERLGAPEVRENLLEALGRRAVTRYLATLRIDEILGVGRTKASEELAALIQSEFDGLEKLIPGGAPTGRLVKVAHAGIEGVHPPTDTAGKFETLVSAEQERQASVEQGEKNRIIVLAGAVGSLSAAETVLAELDVLDRMKIEGKTREEIAGQEQKVLGLLVAAEGRAAAAIQQARADRWTKHMGERGRAERYAGQLRAYRASKKLYAAQQYFDMLKTVMSKSRVYIVADDRSVEVRTNLEDSDISSNAFKTPPKPEPK